MSYLKRTLPALLCCLVAVAGLCSLFLLDNKYTQQFPMTQEGAVYLDEKNIASGTVGALASGWTLWPDVLLAPAELSGTSAPSVETWVGQHLTLRSFHADQSPYGTATFRLNLVSDAPVQVSLLVPEALCASAVWVDGVLLGGTGQLAPYDPNVEDAVYPFTVDGATQLVIQTANYTHYYSGLIYPPVVGSPTAVGRYMVLKTVLYGLLCFSSLTVALFSAASWMGGQKRRDPFHLWFGLLCLAYGLRVCYPFLRGAGVSLIRPLYALEDLSAFMLLYCAARLVCLLAGGERSPWARYGLFPATLAMCAASVVVPLFLLPALPAFSAVYGPLVSWYQLLAALVLLALSLGGTKWKGGVLSLCGLGIYALTQLCAVLWVGPFEPLWGAWPEEYGGFVLVLCFGLLMAAHNREMEAENALLTEHLQEEVARKTADLTSIAAERRRLLSGLLHDLKSPLAAAQGYAELVRENDVALDRDSREKLDLILDKCRDLGGRVRTIQDLNTEVVSHCGLGRLNLSALVEQVWQENAPDVDAAGGDFFLEVPSAPCVVLGESTRLKSALENLVFNAASYTPPGGTITLTLRHGAGYARLEVRDTGLGISPEALPHLFEAGFTTRSDQGGQGLGLEQVATVVQEHGGEVWCSSPPEGGALFTIVLPACRDEEGAK